MGDEGCCSRSWTGGSCLFYNGCCEKSYALVRAGPGLLDGFETDVHLAAQDALHGEDPRVERAVPRRGLDLHAVFLPTKGRVLHAGQQHLNGDVPGTTVGGWAYRGRSRGY